jgi:hypothetical protein
MHQTAQPEVDRLSVAVRTARRQSRFAHIISARSPAAEHGGGRTPGKVPRCGPTSPAAPLPRSSVARSFFLATSHPVLPRPPPTRNRGSAGRDPGEWRDQTLST